MTRAHTLSGNSLRPRAIGFALAGISAALAVKTYIPSASSYVKLDTLIPVVLFRTYLATLAPTSPHLAAKAIENPAEKAAETGKGKDVPDPQKGLGPEQEAKVDLVLEMGWYVALRIWRTFV